MLRSPYFYSVCPLGSDLNKWVYSSSVLRAWSKMPGFRLFHIFAVAAFLLSTWLFQTAAQSTHSTTNGTCSTSSQPNPIAQQYPNAPTGTFNATLAIVPIPLTTAREIIPSQYAILEDAYRALIPGFPADMYPVLMQAGLDHAIQVASMGFDLPDFQVSTNTWK